MGHVTVMASVQFFGRPSQIKEDEAADIPQLNIRTLNDKGTKYDN